MPRHRDEVARSRAVELYRSGLTAKQVAERMGRVKGTVTKWVRDAAATRSQRDAMLLRYSTCAQVPHSFSFIPLTPSTAWLLGMIFGDGNIPPRMKIVTLATSDTDVIDKVRAVVGGPLGFSRVGSTNCFNIRINSVRVVEELMLYFGLTPNKSNTMKFPDIEPAMLPHFCRGLLDSDGGWIVRMDRRIPRLGFGYTSTAREFTSSLVQILAEHTGVRVAPMHLHCKVASPRHAQCYRIKYGHHDALRIGQWLYGPSTPGTRSERKFERWDALARIPLTR